MLVSSLFPFQAASGGTFGIGPIPQDWGIQFIDLKGFIVHRLNFDGSSREAAMLESEQPQVAASMFRKLAGR